MSKWLEGWKERNMKSFMLLTLMDRVCVCFPKYRCTRCKVLFDAETIWPEEHAEAKKTYERLIRNRNGKPKE